MRGKGRLACFFREKKNRERLWLYGLFAVYVLLLIWVVIFKTRFELPRVREQREMNLIPFYYGGTGLNGATAYEAIANVFVFLPLGVYLCLMNIKKWLIPLMGFSSSLCFEMIQFAFAIGVCDVTDLFNNTVGTALGLVICAVLYRICRDKRRLEKIIMIAATALTAAAMIVFFLLMIIQL